MTPLVLWLIDGYGFVVCSAISLVVFMWMIIDGMIPWLNRVVWISLLASLLILASATPISPLLLFSPTVFCVFGLLLLREKSGSLHLLRACGILGFCLSAVGVIDELRWWQPPLVSPDYTEVVVVGDSLSAGIQIVDKAWPKQLEEQIGLKVISVARAGARISDGRRQIENTSIDHRLVIILLGGNDLLAGEASEAYRSALESLVIDVQKRGGRPMLIEFPSLPFRQGFGRAMRDISMSYRVPLLHRRYLAVILGQTGNTLDGLHLSESGHRELAEAVDQSLSLVRH